MVIIGLAIYIISAIGVILYIRYDTDEIDAYTEPTNALFVILCPVLNSMVSMYRVICFMDYINDQFISGFNKSLIKLIKYKRK